jgi:hypothetical protein
VLRVEVVCWAIEVLTSRPVHPFFIAYLHLRSRAVEAGDFSAVRARWGDLGKLLAVPGGPPGKPYYRPLMDGQVHDRSRYWMNPNLAGSWAPSSLRPGQEPLEVVRIVGRGFALDAGHAGRAREHLLGGEKLSVLALAAYLYRDYGFSAEDRELVPADAADVFARDFHFRDSQADDTDFDLLFDTGDPGSPSEWFESYPAQ